MENNFSDIVITRKTLFISCLSRHTCEAKLLPTSKLELRHLFVLKVLNRYISSQI